MIAMTFSAFNHSTLKLLAAAGLLLGSAQLAHARDTSQSIFPADMSAVNLAAHPTCVIYDGGKRALIQGAVVRDGQGQRDAQVAVTSNSGRRSSAVTGDGGFFTVDTTVDSAAPTFHIAGGAEAICQAPPPVADVASADTTSLF